MALRKVDLAHAVLRFSLKFRACRLLHSYRIGRVILDTWGSRQVRRTCYSR